MDVFLVVLVSGKASVIAFGTVRVLKGEGGGEIWFVAKDVCDALTIDTSNLSKLLDDDERSTCPVQYTDQVRAVSIINESGLYSLILRSRKPEAKRFKKWQPRDRP
ncbi:prophage antirepressor [Oleidesulfovibrio alaskensis G20]|uniref:Prophage antirepressor n=1 Tax=Oleidesulfovibrio alaskensis (strain ATCC BAA-1058 / DSM 17464 / G20) TaxID=207559 RepID=Q30XJ6_OLEA2|nr:Bro-N domain-containing protein [Oleidesulfovibrio alaskensis]ABB39600.1 prophage antirepressor [Oleidesulfovibrio alaskensis G20]